MFLKCKLLNKIFNKNFKNCIENSYIHTQKSMDILLNDVLICKLVLNNNWSLP